MTEKKISFPLVASTTTCIV